ARAAGRPQRRPTGCRRPPRAKREGARSARERQVSDARCLHVAPQPADQAIERPVEAPGVDVEETGDLTNCERLPEAQRHEPPLLRAQLIERVPERDPGPPGPCGPPA